MNHTKRTFQVKDLFEVRSGDCHAMSELDEGKVPLVSCGDINNGLVGYFDIPRDWQHSRAITVAYNGSWPLTTKFHPYTFGAKDDVAILVPKSIMKDSVMLYIAAILNRMIWRYSYGRKCFKEKLQDVNLLLPVLRDGKTINEPSIDKLFRGAFTRVEKQTRIHITEIFAASLEN